MKNIGNNSKIISSTLVFVSLIAVLVVIALGTSCSRIVPDGLLQNPPPPDSSNTSTFPSTPEVQMGSDESFPTTHEPTPFPTSHSRLDSLNQIDEFALEYSPGRWANVPLVVNVQVSRHIRNSQETLQELIQTLAINQPQIFHGSYVMGGSLRKEEHLTVSPDDGVIYKNPFPLFELEPSFYLSPYGESGLPNRIPINLENPAASQLFEHAIIEEFEKRIEAFPSLKLAYLDNVGRQENDPKIPRWESYMAFIRKLRMSLAQRGLLTVANIYWGPNCLMTDADSDLIADSMDGFTLEIPFHPVHCRSAPRILNEIATYRKLLKKEMLIQHMPGWFPADPQNPESWTYWYHEQFNPNGHSRAIQTQILAALDMFVWEPEFSIFTSRDYWSQPSEIEWKSWPAEFGKPLSEVSCQHRCTEGERPVLERRFEHALLRVDLAKAESAAEEGLAVSVLRY